MEILLGKKSGLLIELDIEILRLKF